MKGNNMIKSIRLNNFIPYEKQEIFTKNLNFFFGCNGSGKSRLTNYLSTESISQSTNLTWDSSPCPLLIFNKEFVAKNFRNDIKGIFTLGEDTNIKITNISNLENKIKDDNVALAKNIADTKELEDLIITNRTEIIEECWDIQISYGKKFSSALTPHRGKKNDFFSKMLEVYIRNKDDLKPYPMEELESYYNLAFNNKIDLINPIALIPIDKIKEYETCKLLELPFIGSSDSTIGRFIDHLNNSSWIKQGKQYENLADGRCPYCQQPLPNFIRQELEDYFGGYYKLSYNQLNSFYSDYSLNIGKAISDLDTLLDNEILNFDYNNLQILVSTIKNIFNENCYYIEKKISDPTISLSIKPLYSEFEYVNSEIKSLNMLISKNNSIVKNKVFEQSLFTDVIWKSFCHSLEFRLSKYYQNNSIYESKLEKLQDDKAIIEASIKDSSQNIVDIKQTLSSVHGTVIKIDRILKNFGFTNFTLRVNPADDSSYLIVRDNNMDAKETLSEGEYNFITFLYFYFMLFGVQGSAESSDNKVIVIDDPISSLDSKTIFIVTTLIRTLIEKCKSKEDGFLQIFILSHNIFFFKEITRCGNFDYSNKIASYFIIKKTRESSIITIHTYNPIKSTYELLWQELAEEKNTRPITIFNTLRRILEYYFNIVGGIDYKNGIDKFKDNDKYICKSLLESINDGSHYINDEFHVDTTESIDDYLRVFELIFINFGQHEHYKMMISHVSSNLEKVDS
ncbi:AAA family ATPase [uncultured Sphaerochaeta sp.]|uniref:AAA family ATPase n=1 Tax=uncultured Sphaerochaeta sp. TaxID=886478 RepID=UPI002AA6FC3C|nr:AAA family ATPase [uncultured Sphaerochaeta sp.]